MAFIIKLGFAFQRLITADQESQGESQDEKNDCQIDGELLQHVGGLGTSDLVHHSVTKGRAKAFLLRALHKYDKDEEEADENLDHGKDANQNVHKGRRI